MKSRHLLGCLVMLAAVSALSLAGCAHKKPPINVNPNPTDTTTQTTPPPTPAPTDSSGDHPGQTGTEEVSALTDVHFDLDSSDLSDEAKTTLSANGAYLLKHMDMSVSVEGHCDERGTVQYNLALGERRATAAKDFLVSYGVGESRISTISYGKEQPANLGHDDAAWAENRRAHFVKVSK